MKKAIYLLIALLQTLVAAAQYGQEYKMPVLEGKYIYPDGLGYIEFTGEQYGYYMLAREEYDGRIYFGTYSYLPELNYSNPSYNTGHGTLSISWWCGSTVEAKVSGLGSHTLGLSVSHLGNVQNLRLRRSGNCTLTNQDVISQQNGTHPTYYSQTKPTTSGTGLGACYAGTWKRKDGRGTLELAPAGVMRYTLDGKAVIGKYEYVPPYSSLGYKYGSLYFYWHEGGSEQCYVTRFNNRYMTIEDGKAVNEYEYVEAKAITKEEADKISLGNKYKNEGPDGNPEPTPIQHGTNKSKQSIVGKWQAEGGGEILEFSDDTYFRTSSSKSTDKSYGTYTHNIGYGSLRLHFATQDNPVDVIIRSVSPTELIIESGTTLPSRYKFVGKTTLNRNAVGSAWGDYLDGKGGEGEHPTAYPAFCGECDGYGTEKCSRCYGEGQIDEDYDDWDPYENRYLRKTRRVSCPKCYGDGCLKCEGYTCTMRRSIDAHSDYVLHGYTISCNSFSSKKRYYLVRNGVGGQKIIWFQ